MESFAAAYRITGCVDLPKKKFRLTAMNRSSSRVPTGARVPPADERMPVVLMASPHPATWPATRLEAVCQTRSQTRSGPGGQHRNRTASGVFATLQVTAAEGSRAAAPGEALAFTGEATEQRSQHRNRELALRRLRYVLACSIRTMSSLDPTEADKSTEDGGDQNGLEETIRKKYQGTALKLADDNSDKPALLAVLLNDWLVAGGQPSLVGRHWNVSTSRVVAAVRSVPQAWTWANRVRAHHDRPPLRR